MGNVIQYCYKFDCINQCFTKQYKRWTLPSDSEPNRIDSCGLCRLPFHGNHLDLVRRPHGKRNWISAYIAWALNRSHSPLLLDDALVETPVEVNSQDFTGVNSVSWISDTGASDASHTLYREVDPYNYTPMNGSFLPSPTPSLVDGSDIQKTGSWVAVTKLSGPKNQTSTSAVFVPHLDETMVHTHPSGKSATNPTCDEEVDGLELARLARNLWSRGSVPQRRTRAEMHDRNVAVATTNVLPKVSGFVGQSDPIVSQPSCALHSDVLNVRSQPSNHEIPCSTTDSFNAETQSPVELDWDHEPGTASPHLEHENVKRMRLSTRFRPDSLADSDRSNDEDQFSQLNLYPVRPRRRTRNIALLPVTGISDIDDHVPESKNVTWSSKRWSYTDSLVPTKSEVLSPVARDAIGSDSSYTAATTTATTADAPKLETSSNELFDSGFVGLGTSFVEGESDAVGCRTTDHMLWENESFPDSQLRPTCNRVLNI